jgi:monoterpene epsilon-lactone hydrolase
VLPAAACLSPVADMSDRGHLFAQGYDALLHPRAAKAYQKAFVARNDARNPLVSPVYGDWHGLPPLLIHAGEEELLREDAIRSDMLARAAGVNVRLEIYPRMWHVWQLNLDMPDAQRSLDDIAEFLTERLERASVSSD